MYTTQLRLTLIGIAGLGSACSFFSPTADDAGHDAWVRQTVPMVTGRHPKGYAETKALARLARDVGRGPVVEALADSDDYVDYWTEVIIDMLRVERTGGYAQNAACYDEAKVPRIFADELVHHLMFDDPRNGSDDWCHKRIWTTPGAPAQIGGEGNGESGSSTRGVLRGRDGLADLEAMRQWSVRCPDFTMRDVIRAALWTDNLSVIWSAHLFPFTTSGDVDTASDNTRQLNLVNRFMRTYTNRDDTCMGCHTTTFSVSGNIDPGYTGRWDRHAPAAGWFGSAYNTRIDLEGTAFSVVNSAGNTLYGGHGERASLLRGFFETTQNADPSAPGMRPWGMAAACSQLTGSQRSVDGFEASYAATKSAAIAMQDYGPQDGVFTLVDMMQRSTWDLRGTSLNTLPTVEAANIAAWWTNVGSHGAGWYSACNTCHASSSYAPNLATTVASMNPETLARILESGSGRMPAFSALSITPPTGAESYTARQVARDLSYYVRTSGLGTNRGHDMLQTPSHAVTLLYAGATINAVVQEITGAPLELEHGQSRNTAQGGQLAHLTSRLITSNWSLKAILTDLATSPWVGRRNPSAATTADYPLPEVVFPWSMTESGSGTGADDHNGLGDLVHERSVAHRGHLLHAALGWPDVLAFGGRAGESWPDETLMADMGRFSTSTSERRTMAALDTLLAWDELVGACEKPALVLAGAVETDPADGFADTDLIGPDDWDDFIDEVVQDAQAASASFVLANPTVEELFGAVRDRILSDARLTTDEAAAVQALLPDPSVWTRTVGLPFLGHAGAPASFEDELRVYCGALMTSPQVMLGGIDSQRSFSYLLGSPWTACEDGEPCTGDTWCDAWADTLTDLGHSVPSTSCTGIR